MFGSLVNLLGDVTKIVVAPVEIALDATRIVTKPAADLAEEIVKEVKDLTD